MSSLKISATKKIFLEKIIDTDYKYIFNFDVLQFENGYFLFWNTILFQIYDFKFKLIYQVLINVEDANIIDNTSFFIVSINGIYLFFKNQNNIINNKDQEFITLKVDDFQSELIFKCTKYFEKRRLLYNKQKQKLFLLDKTEILMFNYYPNIQKLELINRMKICEYMTYTLFRNNYLIFKKNDNDKMLNTYDCHTMKEIKPKFEIKIYKSCYKEDTFEKYRLMNYNKDYFIFFDFGYMQIFDFNKRQLVHIFLMKSVCPRYINITKNYILISSEFSFDIYDKKNLTFIQSKTCRCCGDNEPNPSLEIENNKILLFKDNFVLVFSMNNKIKICLIALLRFLYIFFALYFLIHTLLVNKIRVLHIIINIFNLYKAYNLLFRYNTIDTFLISTYC